MRGIDPEPERERILRICHAPRSVAEVAAIVRVPLGVARVLVADLEVEASSTSRIPMWPTPERCSPPAT